MNRSPLHQQVDTLPDMVLTVIDDLATAVPTRECFSPLLTCLPGILFAAYRAQVMGEPYFRGFGGGRSAEGGGGISRLRDSQQISKVRR